MLTHLGQLIEFLHGDDGIDLVSRGFVRDDGDGPRVDHLLWDEAILGVMPASPAEWQTFYDDLQTQHDSQAFADWRVAKPTEDGVRQALANYDAKSALRALALLTFREINRLRVRGGLAEYTLQQFRDAFENEYRGL